MSEVVITIALYCLGFLLGYLVSCAILILVIKFKLDYKFFDWLKK